VRRDRAGFTLIEAMVALVLAGAVLAAAFGVAAADARASRRAAELHSAATLADDLLARVAVAPPGQLARWSRGESGWFDAPMDRFAWRITTSSIPNEDALVGVRAEVLWNGGSFTVHTRVSP
jgi:prepilin-type N-terminal cleavage/methylation domain-containing protein